MLRTQIKTVYVKLDDHDFAALVAGGMVETIGRPELAAEDVKIRMILADIGYRRMLQLIDHAMHGEKPGDK